MNWSPKCGGKANGYSDFSVVTGFDSVLCGIRTAPKSSRLLDGDRTQRKRRCVRLQEEETV